MKTAFKFFGIAIILMVGFTILGCSEDEPDQKDTPVTGTWSGLTIPSQNTAVLHNSFQGRSNVLQVKPGSHWSVLEYSLGSYIGTPIYINISMEVWVNTATGVAWQENKTYELVCGSYTNITPNQWHTISINNYTITPAADQLIYLSREVLGNNDVYIRNVSIYITQGPLWFKTQGKTIMAHFMPWHEGPTYKSQENNQSAYGYHWTQVWSKPWLKTGDRADAATRTYPLTGPYDGKADHLVRYQVALMKLAGIDGVLICWYGISNNYDAPFNQTVSQKMVQITEEANQKFAIVLEDWNTAGGPAPWPNNTSQSNVTWLRNNWFGKSQYLRASNGQPLLMIFGPQGDLNVPSRPSLLNDIYFVDLWNFVSWADSTYPWPTLDMTNYLNSIYNSLKYANSSFKVGTVWPRFEDCYVENNAGYRYPYIPYNDGETFRLSWERTIQSNPDVIQIATWNDFGEGTVIEPTREYGYNELEFIQAQNKDWDSSFPYTAADLRIPLEFYKLQYNQTATAQQNTLIQEAYTALWNGDAATFRSKALQILGSLPDTSSLRPITR